MGAPPFKWTPEAEEEIFNRMIRGEGIVQICAPGRDDFLPSERTFYKRLTEDEAFAQRYARAREIQADHEFDEIKAIADTANAENVKVARLRIDARRWRAGKLRPKVYGDKVELSGNAESPLVMQVLTGVPRSED
jgi:hypothetical protein